MGLAEDAFRAHYDDVYRYVRPRTATHAEAEDIVAQVFEEAAARLGAFRSGPAPVLAWLYTVARRRLVDAARRHARHGAPVPLDGVEAAAPEYAENVAHAIRAALADLPEGQRSVVLLRLVEGRSFAEIAKRLEVTEAAAKMRFARGVSAVKTRLEAEGIKP
jgi:RNA polymerase sigma-70 factor (ECF subfamily)